MDIQQWSLYRPRQNELRILVFNFSNAYFTQKRNVEQPVVLVTISRKVEKETTKSILLQLKMTFQQVFTKYLVEQLNNGFKDYDGKELNNETFAVYHLVHQI